MLRVSGHCPASHEYDHSWNQVSFRSTGSCATQPYANQASGPPDDSHRGVLQVIVHPRATPAMLGKGVDATPCSDDKAVKEFLASTGPFQPHLADEEKDDEDDSVSDECTSHNKVR